MFGGFVSRTMQIIQCICRSTFVFLWVSNSQLLKNQECLKCLRPVLCRLIDIALSLEWVYMSQIGAPVMERDVSLAMMTTSPWIRSVRCRYKGHPDGTFDPSSLKLNGTFTAGIRVELCPQNGFVYPYWDGPDKTPSASSVAIPDGQSLMTVARLEMWYTRFAFGPCGHVCGPHVSPVLGRRWPAVCNGGEALWSASHIMELTETCASYCPRPTKKITTSTHHRLSVSCLLGVAYCSNNVPGNHQHKFAAA